MSFSSSYLQHGHDPGGPGVADGPHQDHSGDHIGNGEILDFGDAEACRQHDEATAGLEVIDHGGVVSGKISRAHRNKMMKMMNCGMATKLVTIPSEQAKIMAVKMSRMDLASRML